MTRNSRPRTTNPTGDRSGAVFFIPARLGSKGIARKNLQGIDGKSLVTIAFDTLIDAFPHDDVVVSSDESAASDFGPLVSRGAIFHARPSEFTMDHSRVEDAVRHFLEFDVGSLARRPDFVVLVEPTSPFRTARTLKDFVSRAVAAPDHNYMTVKLLYARAGSISDGRFSPFSAAARRQDRDPVALEAGVAYSLSTDRLLAGDPFVGSGTPALVVSEMEGFDINTPDDLEVARAVAQWRGRD